jgi:xylulokinase
VTSAGRVAVLDVGTTAVKAAIVGADGVVLRGASAPVPTATPAPAHVEQDPADWWAAAAAASEVFAGEPVDALAVTGQMQTTVLVPRQGSPGPALLYSDQRAPVEHARLTAALGSAWAGAVGAAPDATNVAAKWAWLRAHDPARADAATSVLVGAHSWLVHELTGVAACDPTTAATTGLFDLAAGGWWQPVLDAAGLPRELLPAVVDPTTVTGTLRAGSAKEIGLPAGLPVVHAAGDALATTLGVLGVERDRAYAYLGTSGWVARTGAARPRSAGTIALPSLAGDWLAIGPLLACGAAVDWARQTLLGGATPAGADELAAGVCAAAEGVLFLPHLDGSRVPRPDPLATGVLVGLRRSTTPAVLAAAVYEGVAQALRAIADEVALGVADLTACGGGTRSPVLSQVLADVTGSQVHVVADEYAPSRGAAACALAALGRPAPPPPEPTRTHRPDPARHAHHRRVAPVFDELAAAVATSAARLTPHEKEQSPA